MFLQRVKMAIGSIGASPKLKNGSSLYDAFTSDAFHYDALVWKHRCVPPI